MTVIGLKTLQQINRTDLTIELFKHWKSSFKYNLNQNSHNVYDSNGLINNNSFLVEFIKNMIISLDINGVLVIGMPTLESQPFASVLSIEGHVNCKSMPDLKLLMKNYFHNVFIFSMNDEVVHTGYHKLAHYLLAVCVGKK